MLNFTAGAKLISEYTPIIYGFSVLIVGVIILFYLLAGGFDTVVKTDIIQTFGIFLLFVLMMDLLFTTDTKPQLAFMDLFRTPAQEIVSFFLAGSTWAFALILRDIVDETFFFVSLTMSLGFLVLVNPVLAHLY